MPWSVFTAGEKLTAAKLNEKLASWIKFNGTGTIAINDSYNVSSIVDGGTGNYTINWDQDFANADYASVFGAVNRFYVKQGSQAGGAISVLCYDSTTDAAGDPSVVTVIAVGDQT